MPLLLGIDVGTSRTKAVLMDRAGREAGRASATTPFVTDDGRVELTVDALVDCVSGVVGRLGDACRDVAAVGIAGMAESGAPFDADREALAPVIAWLDQRGTEAVERLEREFGDELPLRIGQPVRTVLTAAKLGWLVDHGVTDPVRWLGVPELVLHALTGVEATEYSLAARTGCYDVATKRWMPEVAEALGFSVDLFPPVQPAGTGMGHTSGHWSAGLPPGIPVTVAGHDHLAGMAGAGVGPRSLGNSIGTAETVVARSPTLPDLAAALERRAAVTLYPGGNEWAVLVSAARAGVVLETAAGALGHTYEELDAMAEGAEPVDAAGAVDDLAGGDARSLPAAEPGGVWAGLLDALSARTADGCGRLVELVGEPEEIVVFGGGSVSEPWLRAKAARVDLPLRRSTGESAVARGAAVHAGVAAGWWESADDAPTPPAD